MESSGRPVYVAKFKWMDTIGWSFHPIEALDINAVNIKVIKMKIKRYKKVHKYLNFYINNFGFRSPYQILVDGTFCYAALNNKINIQDNLPRYLQDELKILTTQCAIIETENLGANVHGALVILKKFALHKCGHEGNPIPASKCFLSMIGKKNTNHYMIATQDRDLQQKIRDVPCVPLIYLHQKAPVLEQPSTVSLQISTRNIQYRLNVRSEEKSVIEELKEKSGIAENGGVVKKRKKKKGGPNPLSCKKKKKSDGQPVKKAGENVEKRRKKIRIAQHVKEMLK